MTASNPTQELRKCAVFVMLKWSYEHFRRYLQFLLIVFFLITLRYRQISWSEERTSIASDKPNYWALSYFSCHFLTLYARDFLIRDASGYVLWCYGYCHGMRNKKEPSSNSSRICCIKLCTNTLAKRYKSRTDWVLYCREITCLAINRKRPDCSSVSHGWYLTNWCKLASEDYT